jgi:hypothetical protein
MEESTERRTEMAFTEHVEREGRFQQPKSIRYERYPLSIWAAFFFFILWHFLEKIVEKR